MSGKLGKMLRASMVFLLGAVGCATSSVGPARGRDLHASATVKGGAAGRVVVTGPALLLHVSVEGQSDVSLYKVTAGEGGEVGCDAAAKVAGGKATAVRRGASNRVNLRVGRGEAVCVASAAPAGRAEAAQRSEVRWHACMLPPGLADGGMLAFEDRSSGEEP